MTTQNPSNEPSRQGGPASGSNSPKNEGAEHSGFAEKSHQTAEQLKNAAMNQVGELRERADSAKGQAVERIRRVGTALRWAGDGLREQDEVVAAYAEAASRRIESLADYLGAADSRTLLRDTEEFARRKPALFFGGALLLGFAAGRFVKSSQSSSSGANGNDLDAERDRP